MKTMKRTLAVLLAAVLLCVGVSLGAQAKDTLAPTGSCGDGVTWSFDADTGALTISGEGAIDDYAFQNKTEIKSVQINNGVTSIGTSAFTNCSNLMSVTVGNTLLSVGDYAFSTCRLLESLKLGNSVKSIGRGAFSSCSTLKSLIIPFNVETIDIEAFYGCTDLVNVMIGESVTTINNSAFFGCNSLTSILISKSVSTIGSYAFYPCALKDVYYEASAEEWEAVSIGDVNGNLTQATFHFNYQHESVECEPVRENEQQATCKTAASYESVTYCTLCGEELSRETVYEGEPDPEAHDMQIQPYVAPTCEEGGYAPFVCSRCGYTIKTDPEPALGHDYKPTYEWASDNSTVTASLTCTRCGDVSAKETVGTFQKMVEATCTNPGQVTYTSEGFVNKAFYVQTKTVEIAQKPHATMRIREVSPTCDKEGVGSCWTCSACNGIFEDEAATKPLTEPPMLPKLPHTPGEPVTENETAATCTAGGSYDTVVYCFACSAELSRDTTETPAIDHADADNDGHCDACGTQMTGGDHCKVCGKIHNGNFFDKLTGFFHRIIGIFKR